MPKARNNFLDALRLAVVMAQEEEICALSWIILPAVLRLDSFAEKCDPKRVQIAPHILIGNA